MFETKTRYLNRITHLRCLAEQRSQDMCGIEDLMAKEGDKYGGSALTSASPNGPSPMYEIEPGVKL